MWVIEYLNVAGLKSLWIFVNEYETQEEALAECYEFRKSKEFRVKTRVFLRNPRKDLEG